MSLMQETPVGPAQCRFDHSALAYKKSVRPDLDGGPPVAQDAQGIWQVRGFEEARAVLRSGATFATAFAVPSAVPIVRLYTARRTRSSAAVPRPRHRRSRRLLQ